MHCSNCGKQLEDRARFCSMCGVARVELGAAGRVPSTRMSGPLLRARTGRMIAGVCAGLAEQYNWDLSVVRLVAVGLAFLSGVGLLVYVAAWIIIPDGQYALQAPPPRPDTPEPAGGAGSMAR